MMLSRRPLTNQIKTTLAAAPLVTDVGVAHAPANVGWNGQPNQQGSNFRPYAVLSPGASGPYTGPVGGNLQDWQLPYMVTTFGISPDQVELIADNLRFQFVTLKNEQLVLGDYTYKVQQVRIESIGSIQRVEVTEPPYYGQTDSYSVWLSKEPS